MHAKLRSALSGLGGTDAVVMQSIVGEELAQDPYVAAREPVDPGFLAQGSRIFLRGATL